MKKEDLIQYASTEDWIREQSYRLYKIAVEEHPKQFGSFILHDAHFHEVEITDTEVTFSFEEGRGDWFEKHYFRIPIETFLDEEAFREIQKSDRIQYDKNIEDAKRTKEEKIQADELKALARLKQKYENK